MISQEFDVNQGHGGHNECVCESGDVREFFRGLPKRVSNAELIGATNSPVACNFDETMPREMRMMLWGDKTNSVRLEILVGVDEVGQRNMLVSAYPEADGAEVNVKITAIHELANGVEATLEGEVLGDAAREIAFFDTRYVLNKGLYEIGKTYAFRLSAFAYKADVLPEKDREIRLEGEKAVEFRKQTGKEQEFDEDGNPKPEVFGMESMVAYIPHYGPYPDDAEFQSPAFGDVESVSALDTDFYKITIGIAREEEDVLIPLVARKSLFTVEPKPNDPVRGILWLQGYCPDAGGSVRK